MSAGCYMDFVGVFWSKCFVYERSEGFRKTRLNNRTISRFDCITKNEDGSLMKTRDQTGGLQRPEIKINRTTLVAKKQLTRSWRSTNRFCKLD